MTRYLPARSEAASPRGSAPEGRHTAAPAVAPAVAPPWPPP